MVSSLSPVVAYSVGFATAPFEIALIENSISFSGIFLVAICKCSYFASCGVADGYMTDFVLFSYFSACDFGWYRVSCFCFCEHSLPAHCGVFFWLKPSGCEIRFLTVTFAVSSFGED